MFVSYNCGDEQEGGAMPPPALERQFNDFYHAAYADGELDGKTKVLIGLARIIRENDSRIMRA